MNEEEIQMNLTGPDDPIEGAVTPEIEDITPDESAASLAFATNLSERFMEQQAIDHGIGQEEAPQEAETSPGGEETLEVVEDPVVEEQPEEADIEALVDAKVEEKMSALREELTNALSEEDDKSEE